MAPQEKSAWILLVCAVVSWTTYLVLLLRRADGAPLATTQYQDLVLWIIGGSIVVAIVLHAFARVDSSQADQRDREIEGRADRISTAFLVIGGIAALALAMTEQPHFWIANVLYLAFVLTAILGSVARIGFYRGGVPEW